MKGRDKCELLNEIRQKIADENDIEFTIYDCTFEGDCTGTCPKCESELEYLERELEKKQKAGEKINLKGIFTFKNDNPGYDIPNDDELISGVLAPFELEGIPAYDEEEYRKIQREQRNHLLGDIAPPKDSDEDY